MAGRVSRAAGEPPLCKRCKCGTDTDDLSEYHLKKHLEGQRHRSGVIQSMPISAFFLAATAAGPSSASRLERSRIGEIRVSQTAPPLNSAAAVAAAAAAKAAFALREKQALVELQTQCT